MNRNFWASIFYDGSASFLDTVRKYEDLGLAGLEVPQVYGSPLVHCVIGSSGYRVIKNGGLQ